MKNILLLPLLLLAAAPASRAAIAAAGDIMISGYNADGNDDLAFVLLNDYDANTPIFFTDNEWNGTMWNDSVESFFNWSSAVSLPAGTVITLSFVGTGTLTTNTGSATFNEENNRGLATSNEGIYVYTGAAYNTATPVFLTAFSNSGFASVATGLLTGTGLTEGDTATAFNAGQDIMAYTGDRTSPLAWEAFRPLLANTANWLTEDGAGDQDTNGIGPDVPFDTTSFSAIPEPGSALMAAAGILGLLSLRRRPLKL